MAEIDISTIKDAICWRKPGLSSNVEGSVRERCERGLWRVREEIHSPSPSRYLLPWAPSGEAATVLPGVEEVADPVVTDGDDTLSMGRPGKCGGPGLIRVAFFTIHPIDRLRGSAYVLLAGRSFQGSLTF